jgi:hypothetical protein
MATECYVKLHMFSNAQNLSIRDTAIHNSGRDMTIINNYIYTEPQPVRARFPYVTSSDDLRGSTIIASFKHNISMAQFIFGDYYARLHSFGTHVYLWNACSPK